MAINREVKETVFEFTDADNTACFWSQTKKWINKAKKYAELYPDEVKIVKENADGSICITCPADWFKFSPKTKRVMSDEQKVAVAERLKASRNKKGDSNA